MKTQSLAPMVLADATGVSLRSLINHLVCDSLSSSAGKNFIVNEISPDIWVKDEDKKVTPIISELLARVVNNAKNGKIHISADRFQNVIILEIQERNTFNGYALSYSVKSLESQASQLGGHINIEGHQKLVTTISFSFPNYSKVA